MALKSAGSTAHYSISYDDSLSASDGAARAAQLLAVCEQDYNLMSTWFPGLSLPYALPVAVNIIPGGYAGASWGPPISLRPGNGSGINVVRYLLVAEVVEMFMLAQNKGWFAADGSNEGSAGEGLSRYLSTEFLVQTGLGSTMPGFDTARFWLNSDRLDYVNNIDQYDHAPDAKSGCSTLFLYYLSYQRGYDIKRIIAAGASTLSGVYRNLTGDAADPFPAFKQMLDRAFPRTDARGNPINSVIPGPNPDNPYPLNVTQSEVPMSVRVFWRMNPGRNVVNLNWGAVSADSVVMVSASEYNAGSQKLPDRTDQRFVGAADVTVCNVTPHGPPFDPNRGVTFVVEVGWSAPLNICTDIALVSNAPDAVVYVGPQTESSQTEAAGAYRQVQTQVEAHFEPQRQHETEGGSRSSAGSLSGSASRVTHHEATID
jgi:hypothetical protein